MRLVKGVRVHLIKKVLVLAVVGCIVLPSGQSVFAARPFLTEDASTSDKGVVGIELGLDAKDPSGEIAAGVVAYTGVCDSGEIYVELPMTLKSDVPDVAGKIDTFNLGGKWNFLKSGDEQILTFAASIANLPKETSLWNYTAAMVISKSVGSDITVHGNFGGSFSSKQFENYIWGMGAERPLSEKLNLVAEVYSEMAFFDKGFNDNHITSMLGIAWALSEKAILDFSIRLPLTDAAKSLNEDNEPTEKAHYVVGLTYEF